MGIQEEKAIQKASKAMLIGDKHLDKYFEFRKNYEEAAKCYNQAAVQYKIAKKWEDCATSHIKEAQTYEKKGSQFYSCTAYEKAAKAFVNGEKIDKAIEYFEICATMKTEADKFAPAAGLYQKIAELHEKVFSWDKAIESYLKAAEFLGFDNETSAIAPNNKAAQLRAEKKEEYKEASEMWMKMAEVALGSNLLKWGANEYIFKALLCQFVELGQQQEYEKFEEVFEEAKQISPRFETERECKLIEGCLEGAKDKKDDVFLDAIQSYSRVKPLDDWKESMFHKVLKVIQEGGDEAGEEDVSKYL